MPITADAPLGGTLEQLGGESRPLILRNGEIERFERQHGLGIFAMLDQLLGKGEPQARHCRDLVALGLVGGGLTSWLTTCPHAKTTRSAQWRKTCFWPLSCRQRIKKKPTI